METSPKRPSDRTRYLPLLVAVLILVGLCAAIVWVGKDNFSDPVARVIKSLIWPFLLVIAALFFRQQIEIILESINKLISRVNTVDIKGTHVTLSTVNIPTPTEGHDITLDNIALLHTSFLRPDKTKKFDDGLAYYQIEVIVIARSPVLDRIEWVTYYLAEPYPKRIYPKIKDRSTKFKLQELAFGPSIVKAEVKIRDKEEPLLLNRFITLQDAGPRI